MQNNFGEASSPYFTPVFAIKHDFSSPSIHTVPLFPIYIFLIIYIRLGGILSFTAISSHSVRRFTLSYALFRSINTKPNGVLAFTLYYTNY
jgi:hypothetical protein